MFKQKPSLNQKSNPKHKKPSRKVATFTKPKVATKKLDKNHKAQKAAETDAK
jgi:hypothetical protein